MNETRLKNIIRHFEGYKTEVYIDTTGNKTIGYGHLDNNMIVGQSVGPSIIEQFYKNDTLNAISVAKSAVGNTCFDSLSEGRQINLIQLCYNLGHKILEFKKLITSIQNQQWMQSAVELENSLWYSQVGSRGIESCQCFINDKYSFE